MTTPISSSVPFATSSELQLRWDIRSLGDTLADDGTRVTGTTNLNANPTIAAALMDASGMIEMYALKGEKYSVQDLQALTGAGRNLLVRLCCDLAYWALYSRRHPMGQMPQAVAWAFSVLDDISSGAKIFGNLENAAAGVPEDGFETVQDVANRGGITFEARRFFGVRGYQLRGTQTGQGGGGCGCG